VTALFGSFSLEGDRAGEGTARDRTGYPRATCRVPSYNSSRGPGEGAGRNRGGLDDLATFSQLPADKPQRIVEGERNILGGSAPMTSV
jgi:hypothetical protein